mmetsp:Transcript_87617/g.128153  ORF Transcript_87617/g.128153 Transcript_87617/m.128153 type:complete len:128 (-) Transcript_87617:236-619(-)
MSCRALLLPGPCCSEDDGPHTAIVEASDRAISEWSSVSVSSTGRLFRRRKGLVGMAMAESRRGDDGRDGRDGESEQLARLLATLLPRLLRRLPEGGLFEGDAGQECPKMPDIAAPFLDDSPRRAAGV